MMNGINLVRSLRDHFEHAVTARWAHALDDAQIVSTSSSFVCNYISYSI